MLPGTLLLLVPVSLVGPPLLYLGKVLVFASMAVTMVHFTRLYPVVPEGGAVVPDEPSE